MTIGRLGLSLAALAAHAFKVVYGREQFASSIADYFPTSYSLDLQANNVKTGEVLARVRCEADRRGMIALSALPLLDARGTPASVAQR